MNAIDARISELVSAHRPELEQLVRQAVDRELALLVDAELERRGNGSSETAAAAATKVCRGCGRTLPASSFEKHRHVCRECRARQREQRHQAEADTEPPHQPERDHGG